MQTKRLARSSQKGMTLIELLVAMACLVLVLAGVYHVFFTQSLSSTAEINILEAQINARAGMDRIAHVLRHAGFGCRDSFRDGKTMDGNDPNGTLVSVDSMLWNFQDNNATGQPANADAVDVVHGFRKAGEVTTAITTNSTDRDTVYFNSTADDPVVIDDTRNFHDYICFFPHMEGDIFYGVSGSTSPLTVDSDIQLLQEDASIFMVTPTRITLNADGDLIFQIFADGFDDEVASGFEDLQFEYTEDGSTWAGVPANPNKVIAIRAWLLARSARGDPGYTDTRTYTYAGQTVGPFNDNVHRWLIEETVWIRNKVAD